MPDVKQQLLTSGLVAVVSADEPDVRKMVANDAAFWAEFLKKVGLAGTE